jgi:CubicO group peptidase (beta-lactamase class C family)
MNIPLLKTAFAILFATVLISCQRSTLTTARPSFNDYKNFPSRRIAPDSKKKFAFTTRNEQKSPKDITPKLSFEKYLRRSGTVAFIIIREDTIQYEKYFKGYDQTSLVNSFSIAKSITSLLIGCAVDDKLIASIEDPVTHYIPELTADGFDKITIRHLLQMTSGIKFKENYEDRKEDALMLYYGENTRKYLTSVKTDSKPGMNFDYVSINSQLLGLILERALKGKTVSQYLQDRIWQPMGMQYTASWSIDKEKAGLEKTFCCLTARAIDFAKIGRLYLNNGNWNGVQIVSKNWVSASTTIDTTNGSAWNYQHQWWLPTKSGDFMAEGHLGQFIYVNPDKNLIIVRFGEKDGDVNWWLQFLALAAEY